LLCAVALTADTKTISITTGANRNTWYIAENPDPLYPGVQTTWNGALAYRAVPVASSPTSYPFIHPYTFQQVWAANTAASGWMSNRTYPGSSAPCSDPYLWCQGSARGLYKYAVSVQVPEAVPGTVRVRGRWMTDGIGSALDLNGTVYSGAGFSSIYYDRWQNFYLPVGGKTGGNVLTIWVSNDGGGPHGFRMEAVVEYDPK
jgi:hypothetical protein